MAANEAGLVWNEENLSAYLADPADFMQSYLDDPKASAKKAFKLRDKQDRLDVVAHLQQFSAPMESEDENDEPEEIGEDDEKDHAALMPAGNKVCLQNAAAHPYVFAAESKGAERVTATLAPGELLCSTAQGPGWSGVVSIHESDTGFEGCSRLVQTGTLEQMHAYADFDRCAWSSNSRT